MKTIGTRAASGCTIIYDTRNTPILSHRWVLPEHCGEKSFFSSSGDICNPSSPLKLRSDSQKVGVSILSEKSGWCLPHVNPTPLKAHINPFKLITMLISTQFEEFCRNVSRRAPAAAQHHQQYVRMRAPVSSESSSFTIPARRVGAA